MKVFSGISFLPWRNGLIGPRGLDHPWPKGHFQGEEILRVDQGWEEDHSHSSHPK